MSVESIFTLGNDEIAPLASPKHHSSGRKSNKERTDTNGDYLQKWKSQGNKLILWTCRAGDALDAAVAWCQSHQLEFDAVNDNLPEIIEYYANGTGDFSEYEMEVLSDKKATMEELYFLNVWREMNSRLK